MPRVHSKQRPSLLLAVIGVLVLFLACASPPPVTQADPVERTDAMPPSVAQVPGWTWPTTAEGASETARKVMESMAQTGGRPVLLRDDAIWVMAVEARSNMDVVRRKPSGRLTGQGETFTEAAQNADLDSPIDIVINGMTYSLDVDLHSRGSRKATHSDAHGQALQSGKVEGGQQLRKTTSRFHFVQKSDTGGFDASDWVVGPGNKDTGTGLSGVMAILADGKRIGSPGGVANKDSDKLLRLPKGAGMPYIGIDENRQLIWIIVKTWGQAQNADTTRVQDVRETLAWLGVRNAVALDGGDSVCLVVDGHVLVRPSDYKNRSIPFGLRFSWTPRTEKRGNAATDW